MGNRGSRDNRDKLLSGSDSDSRSNHSNITDSEYWNKNSLLRTDFKASGLLPIPKDIILQQKENRKFHYTDEYESPNLILRRGWSFKLDIILDKVFKKDDRVTIQFATGFRPEEKNGTIIRLTPFNENENGPQFHGWTMSNVAIDGCYVTVKVTIPADAIVGRYWVFVESQTSNGQIYRIRHKNELYVLFNPWCKDDDAYLDNEVERHEYVLNETGRIWRGTLPNAAPSPWNYGQFDEPCLDCALMLLDLAELSSPVRSDPVMVVRTLSAMSNSDDSDGGVLTGKWASHYPSPCTKPWVWTGSVAILEQFMKSKKAVRYGQCWVFAGITTSLLRALGIPTRVVTTFQSGIDRDDSMTVDRHWSNDDRNVSWKDESEWNFHVWTESWLKRRDLPPGYDGWQAQDATPQERSQGIFRCGPASVKAIKEGHVYLNYDTKFLMAEVNGDRAHWLVKRDGSLVITKLDKDYVGKYISTKAVGSNDREDITYHYKYPEGSEKNKLAMETAMKFSSRRKYVETKPMKDDVVIELLTPDGVAIGSDFTIGIKVNNISEEIQKMRLLVSVSTAYYTNVADVAIEEEEYYLTLKPGEEHDEIMAISQAQYLSRLRDEAFIRIEAKAVTLEKLMFASGAIFQLVKPSLHISAPERVAVGKEFTVTLQFLNPLQVKLTNNYFRLEGAGVLSPMLISHSRSVKPGEEILKTVTLKARRPGRRELIVSHSSDELVGVEGCVEINFDL